MATKNNPGKFDCYANAKPDEPYFLLLGRDATAPLIVLAWIALRAKCGFNDVEQLKEARACALAMQAYAVSIGKKDLVSRAKQKAASLLVQHASEVIEDAITLAVEEQLGDVFDSNGAASHEQGA
jgi:hypothetical protein